MVRRTYAPRGKTPILEAWYRKGRISAISAVTVSPVRRRLNLFFRLLADNTNAHGEDTVAFLAQLRGEIKGPMTILWDQSKIHERSGVVKVYLAKHPEILTEDFPGYAPEPTRTRGYGATPSTTGCPTTPPRTRTSFGPGCGASYRHCGGDPTCSPRSSGTPESHSGCSRRPVVHAGLSSSSLIFGDFEMTKDRGLASIIVPCWNQLEFTRQCLAALRRHTTVSWELIVVDNGSTDGTGDYLEGWRDAATIPATVLRNSENRGFPAACNQGIQAAKGRYLVLLNNDAVPTSDWLDQLVALLESDPGIGMVGPMTNYAAPPQLVEPVSYDDLEGMHRFASRWRAEHRGQWFEVPKLSGFCLVAKRTAIDAVGTLDERFGLRFFDDDLALRMRKAGFRMAVAHDLFVHHFGSRTFAGAGIDAPRLLEENAAKFAAKWGDQAPVGRVVGLSAWAEGRSGVADPASRPKVSLTMIVRNEEHNLPACLESVRGVFDEVVVVDTGSTDHTVEIARSFGARVFDFPWVDDFAAARNAALARATGDYAFWLDADDVLEPLERDKLRLLLAELRPGDDAAFVVRCACDPDEQGGGGQTVVDHMRLFPLREDVRWSYRVHEQILPSLRRAGIPVRWSDVVVRHTGYADAATRVRKLSRDEKILLEELTERPNDAFVRFNLGSIAIERKDWRHALDHLQASLNASAPGDSITRKLYALIARSHQMLGQPDRALAACAEGLALDADDAELLFRQAVLHRGLGHRAEAAASWRRILSLKRPEQFSSVDQGIYGHLTRRNLAAMAEEAGDRDAATRYWNEVLVECPEDVEARGRLARLNSRSTEGIV